MTDDLYLALKQITFGHINAAKAAGIEVKFENINSYIEKVTSQFAIPCDEETKKRLFTDIEYQFKISHAKGSAIFDDYDNRNECFKMFPFGDMPLQLYLLLKGNAYYIDKIMSHYRVFSGGYNSEMLKNREKNKENQLKLKSAIEAFDKFTSFEFHENIKVWSKRLDIEIKCLSGDVKGVFSKSNKEYLKKMGRLFCVKLYCRTKFPKTYFKIGCLKRIIKGK